MTIERAYLLAIIAVLTKNDDVMFWLIDILIIVTMAHAAAWIWGKLHAYRIRKDDDI